MSFIDKNQKLECLLELIEKQSTGPANRLADKVCVSTATLERYLSLLRNQGYRIGFCASRKTYYFIEN